MKRLLMTALLLAPVALVGCGQPGLENPLSVPLTLTLTPATVSLTPGTSTTVAVTARVGDQLTATPNLQVTAPEGITVTTVTGGLNVSALSSALPGTYAVQVQGRAGLSSGRGVMTVTVEPSTNADSVVSLILTPSTVTLKAGDETHVAALLYVDGRPVPLPQLQSTGAPGVEVTTDATGVNLKIGSDAVIGTYSVPVTGTFEGREIASNVIVRVTRAQEATP